jgi:hypothetical protein
MNDLATSRDEIEKIISELPRPVIDAISRRYHAAFAAKGGAVAMSRTKRSLLARRNAKRVWELRRQLYGPSGRTLKKSKRHD